MYDENEQDFNSSAENVNQNEQKLDHDEQEMNDKKDEFSETSHVEGKSVDVTIDQDTEDILKAMESEEVGKKKQPSFRRTLMKVIAAAMVFGLVAGGVFVGVDSIANRIHAANTETTDEETSTQLSSEVTTYTGVSEIVANAKPAIVAITSTTKAVSYDFFGRPIIQQASGAGSGIIVGQSDNELLIATNYHVVSDASNIVIQFIDDSSVTGKVKGMDETNDLAVVSVDLHDLSKDTLKKINIATLGNSDDCKQGELVVAIGNALGYGQSTTVGYVSVLNREVTTDGVTLNLLQTDAAINPGNSGGALLNAKGEVIGINSIKNVQADVEGVGYAIPISTAVPIINELMNRTELKDSEKAYLGIAGKDVTESEAQMLNIPVGIYVNKVEDGSPADKAGIKIRDIITGVSGRNIDTQEELQEYLSVTRAGTKVTFTVNTNEGNGYIEKEIEVTLGSAK